METIHEAQDQIYQRAELIQRCWAFEFFQKDAVEVKMAQDLALMIQGSIQTMAVF